MATRLYVILYFYEVTLTYKFVQKNQKNIKHEAAPLNQPLSNENEQMRMYEFATNLPKN